VSEISLNLIVLRSSDIEQSAAFYSRLGLRFSRERHGTGPEHFATTLDGVTLELYPLQPDRVAPSDTRIGFRVSSVDAVLAAVSDDPNAVVTPLKESPWGRRAVLADPDGRRVEIIEA